MGTEENTSDWVAKYFNDPRITVKRKSKQIIIPEEENIHGVSFNMLTFGIRKRNNKQRKPYPRRSCRLKANGLE